jgi:serine/threonine protein kinase
MAPELLDGKLYGHKADIWSLGCLLYEMLVGNPPFSGNNIRSLKINIHKGKYTIPSHISLSDNCIDFITRCLKFDV